MAWRTPAANMVRPSTMANPVPQVEGGENLAAPIEGKVNYHAWARAMEMALRSKNKITFVNGTMVIPSETDPKYFYWDQCNTMVLSWILRAVSPTIGRGVLWINTAEGVWKDLKKRFSQQDVFRIAEIKSKIYQTKQGTSSVNEYFTQLKLLWDELLVLRPIPSSETVSYLDTDEHIPVSNPPGVQSMEPEQTNEPANAESNPTHQPRRSTRTRIQPAYLNDYICQNAAVRRTSPHEISKFMSYDSLSTASTVQSSREYLVIKWWILEAFDNLI
nr:uncharacterized protein LOC109156569 [Ipomoea batatas]